MSELPMHRAAKEGDLVKVVQLIEEGVSMDSQDDLGWTLLHLAAKEGRYEVAKLFIDRGCDLNPKDRDGRTPVLCAAFEGRKEVVDLLVERGARVDCADDAGFTLLHFASSEGWLDVVLHLLQERAADVDAATLIGSTPLIWAACRGHEDVAALLIRAGANVRTSDDQRRTALHMAAHFDHTGVVQVLLEQEGLDLNSQDGNGRTPLHYTSRWGSRDAVKQLLEAGADPNIKDFASGTALSMHVMFGCAMPEVIRLLVQHGAFVDEFVFARISRNPALKENVLKDVAVCTLSIVNKFHRHSLPALYRNPYFVEKLPTMDKFELSSRKINEVENLVRREIERNTFCDVVKVRPIALSALCVLSLAALPIQA